MAAQTNADSNDFEGRFRRHFPRRSNDFTLVVLKGHLLLEESVNHLLAALLRKPEAIESANLRFRQKLCLIRALAPEGAKSLEDPEGPSWIFRILDAVEKLNTMRNKLTHHLDHPQIEALVRDFLSLCEEWEDPNEPEAVRAAEQGEIRETAVASLPRCSQLFRLQRHHCINPLADDHPSADHHEDHCYKRRPV